MNHLLAILAAALVCGCSHVEIDARSNTSSGAATPPAGTSVTSGAAGLQVRSDSRALAAVIIAAGVLSLAAEDAREERPFPSPAALLPYRSPPAPELAPDRRISEQDCSKPIDWSLGNLRCK